MGHGASASESTTGAGIWRSGGSWYFGLEMRELLRLPGEPSAAPGRDFTAEYLAKLHQRMVALLYTLARDCHAERTFDLRYIVEPAPHDPNAPQIQLALLCRLRSVPRADVAEYQRSLQNYLKTTMRAYSFQLATASATAGYLQPFCIAQVAAIKRRYALTPFGALRTGRAGFRTAANRELSPAEQKLGLGNALHIYAFAPHQCPVAEFLSFLLCQNEQVALSVRLRPTVLAPEEAQFLL